jgi:hypothetical protein
MSRHVDFFAVLFIALGLFAVSHASSLRFPVDPVRLQPVTLSNQSCPLPSDIASRIEYLLNR